MNNFQETLNEISKFNNQLNENLEKIQKLTNPLQDALNKFKENQNNLQENIIKMDIIPKETSDLLNEYNISLNNSIEKIYKSQNELYKNIEKTNDYMPKWYEDIKFWISTGIGFIGICIGTIALIIK